MLDEIESTKVHKVEEGVRQRKKKEDTEWTKASLKQESTEFCRGKSRGNGSPFI